MFSLIRKTLFCKDEIDEIYIKQKASQNMQTLFVFKVFLFGQR